MSRAPKKLPIELTTGSFNFVVQKLFLAFTNLVADGATGFARALARGLAFAATAAFARGLKIRFVDGLDVFHGISSLNLSGAVDDEVRDLLKGKCGGSFERERQINPRRLNVSLRPRAAIVNRVRGTNNFYRRVDVGGSDFAARDKPFKFGRVVADFQRTNHRQSYDAAFEIAAVRFARDFCVAEEVKQVVNYLEGESESRTVSRKIVDFALRHV